MTNPTTLTVEGMAQLHIRNGRADRCPPTRGAGVTWCGKKLVGEPIRSEGGVVTFSSYGAEVSVTLDPVAGTCAICRERFDTAFDAADRDVQAGRTKRHGAATRVPSLWQFRGAPVTPPAIRAALEEKAK